MPGLKVDFEVSTAKAVKVRQVSMNLTIEERFQAMDVRGQIIRARSEHLTELFLSLEDDFKAKRFRAVILHYRTFMLHAVNAWLVGEIPDDKILEGQTTCGGTDREKLSKALGEDDLLLYPLGKVMHASSPCPEEADKTAAELPALARTRT
jgi:hypothetical protein